MVSGDILDGRFEVLDEIGRGGMGVVLRARDQNSGDLVALKFCNEPDEVSLRRFAREVRCMEMIKHEHVMPVLHSNLGYDPPYFTMPLAVGSLTSEIAAGLTEEDALKSFEEICLGVQAIHNSNATHRDIKPDNAMRMSSGMLVVSDMGLVKFDPRDSTTLTQTVAFVGTRMYCAPEQLGSARDADARTDVYQLGKTLYEMIAREPPALIDTAKVPNGLAYIIERATRQHPDQRYQSVGVLMDAVETYVRAKSPDASPDREFEAAFEESQSLLKSGRYKKENLETLIASLLRFRENSDVLTKQFERLPDELLTVIARNLSSEMQGFLEVYNSALDEIVSDRGFAYGEYVGKKMKTIFDNTDDARVKALAIKATLIVAVRLNRYAAMEILDVMIAQVERPEDALAVADVLREELGHYRVVAERVPRVRLHRVLAEVYDEATTAVTSEPLADEDTPFLR
jgi:eukaryotic-like serine/threonine-protein kinase